MSKTYLLKKDWVTGQDELGEDTLLKVGDMIKGPNKLETESFDEYKLRQKVENGLVRDRLRGLFVPNEFNEVTGRITPHVNSKRQAKKARKLNR